MVLRTLKYSKKREEGVICASLTVFFLLMVVSNVIIDYVDNESSADGEYEYLFLSFNILILCTIVARAVAYMAT